MKSIHRSGRLFPILTVGRLLMLSNTPHANTQEASMPRLNFVMIRASDVATSVAFYENFGLQFKEHQHGTGPTHFCADLGAWAFEIYPAADDIATQNVVRIGFAISNLDETIVRLEAMGHRILVPPAQTQWGYRAVVVDPDDNRVELVQGQAE